MGKVMDAPASADSKVSCCRINKLVLTDFHIDRYSRGCRRVFCAKCREGEGGII